MKDSAGKLSPDKWTRKEEERRVEENGHEELPQEDLKEDQEVPARAPARTHFRNEIADVAPDWQQQSTQQGVSPRPKHPRSPFARLRSRVLA